MSEHWSDKKKTEVVITWLALGKVPMVEGVTGVPAATIRQWKAMPWWKDMVEQVQTESTQELDTKLSKIIDRSLDTVNERIENGEFILDSRTGTVKRIPVKLRDVHRVAVDLLDKRDLMRLRPVQQQALETQRDILKKLADQFADWVQINLRKPRDITNEVTILTSQAQEERQHAVHGQRAQGLQDRVQQISLTEETNTQSGVKE